MTSGAGGLPTGCHERLLHLRHHRWTGLAPFTPTVGPMPESPRRSPPDEALTKRWFFPLLFDGSLGRPGNGSVLPFYDSSAGSYRCFIRHVTVSRENVLPFLY